MRDFLPADVRRREYVIGVIKDVYQKYGFEPLETPAVENLETLLGKYGEEGNQLIFKILKRGEGEKSGEADLALRYDLTVPLARVVANYKNELPKFFKRYQIQPVWRADRPARGRFREFYQCDVDAIGSRSMLVEAELISAVSEALKRLGFNRFSILLNHRELLRGVLEVCGVEQDIQTEALVALDKLDKIGKDGVLSELKGRNIFSEESIEKLGEFIDATRVINQAYDHSIKANENEYRRRASINSASLDSLTNFLGDNTSGKLGIEDIKKILDLTDSSQARGKMSFFPTLARGLSYYTGAIFEIGLDEEDFTLSIGGGGRYDGLIGMFGKEEIPACGFSLGLERILVVMNERGMFQELEERGLLKAKPADVLVTIWNEETVADSLGLADELRAQGLRVAVYPEADKLGKQFKYASSIGVSAVAIVGDEERANNAVTIKYLETGEQETISRDKLSTELRI
ncbi:MAG: histidine--tRNA ligase [Acidobacteriota bacterium]|nr:histidine--tRNA ligase [Acidobacteriota bacterium]